MTNTYVLVHILQDVPPANLNRDDSGSPKQAIYGGVERLRVSSQAWKRATRRHFRDSMGVHQANLGVRTRRLHELLRQALTDRGLSEADALTRAEASLATLKLKLEKKDKADRKGTVDTQYLVFAGRPQLETLADKLAEDGANPAQVDAAQILGSTHTLDVALFGRMVANMTQLNVDAAAQVAHAISTHGIAPQFDYYTAVDDLQDRDEAGAGMIGTVEFNSGTLYRYAAVGLEQLVDNMGDRAVAIDGVGQFITSFVHSMPTGKQNTFAAHTRPALVLVEVREDQPVSLVSAFEQPVRASEGSGYLAASLSRLAGYYQDEARRWGDEPALAIASYATSGADPQRLDAAFGKSVSLTTMVDRVKDTLGRVRTDV